MALLQPTRIRILAIGKLKRAWVAEGVAFYRKRLPGLEMVELKDSTPAKEAEAIRAARKPAERLVLLSEEGRQLSSVGLAELLGSWASERLALVIGGADGLTPALKAQAHWRLMTPLMLAALKGLAALKKRRKFVLAVGVVDAFVPDE